MLVARNIAQCHKYLPGKYKVLSLISGLKKKKKYASTETTFVNLYISDFPDLYFAFKRYGKLVFLILR